MSVRGLDTHAETRWGLNFLAVFGAIIALWLGKPLLMPLAVALMLAAVAWPVVNYLRIRWWLSRSVAASLVMTALIIMVVLIIIAGVVAAQGTWREYATPDGQWKLYERVHQQISLEISPEIAKHYFPIDPEKPATDKEQPAPPDTAEQKLREVLPRSVLFGTMKRFFEDQQRNIPEYLISTGGSMMMILLILFLALFVWIDGDALGKRVAEIFGPKRSPDFSKAQKALEEMARQVRSYLVWRTIINVGMAIALGFSYEALGLKQPWTWAIFASVLAYIPYIGNVLGGVPAVFDGFVSQGFYTVAIIMAIYGGILLLEGYVIFPVVIGRNMEMNAITVILACLFWELVWGSIGLFLAMPLTAALKAICANVPSLRAWANLMGMHELPPEETPQPTIWPPEIITEVTHTTPVT